MQYNTEVNASKGSRHDSPCLHVLNELLVYKVKKNKFVLVTKHCIKSSGGVDQPILNNSTKIDMNDPVHTPVTLRLRKELVQSCLGHAIYNQDCPMNMQQKLSN